MRRRLALRLTVLAVLVTVAAGSVVAARLGLVSRLRARIFGTAPRLVAGDFPAGVMAPVDEVVKVPLRPIVVGLVPRGTTAPLMYAAGDPQRPGLFRTAYAIDVDVRVYYREDELRRALILGAEGGGVDAAVLPVSSLAMSASVLKDAAPRVVLLVGRSRGQDVVAVKHPIDSVGKLVGKRIAAEPRSASWYLLLWSLSRAGLSLRDVTLVPLESAFDAGEKLRSGEVDAAAGYVGDLAPAARLAGASVLTSTADAPHLLASVLVTRGDFLARYPDGIRRLTRGVLDAAAAAQKDSAPVARLLGTLAPRLGDPAEAIAGSSMATLEDNLAFFGLSDPPPVTFAELFSAGTALNTKLFKAPPAPEPEAVVELWTLRYLAAPPAR